MLMNRGRLLAIVLILGSALDAAAQEEGPGPPLRESNAGRGLFRYQSLSLFPSLRSGFETRFPSDLREGGFELSVDETWVKNLSDQDLWRFDFELVKTRVAFSWGVTDDLRLDVGVGSAERTGGALDALILGFHRTFDLPLEGRDHFARNENRIELQPPGGGPRIVVDQHDPQPFDQAILLTLEHTITQGDETVPAVTWALSVRRELQSGDLHGGAPVDLGASLAFAKQVDEVRFYLGGTYSWFGRDDFFGLKLRTTEWSGTFGVEWSVGEDVALLAQYVLTSGGVDAMRELSRPSHEVLAGFTWEVGAGVRVHLALIENLFVFDNSPDFGVHAGVTVRW